jgi:tetratricopeptide (TPR) repeat protein
MNHTTQAIPAPISSAIPINRYIYRNPPKPASGNRTLAQKFFLQGSQAHQAKRTADAVAAYRGAVQADPSHFEAWFNLALIATETGSLGDGLADYEHALAIRPDSADARYNFALLLRQANYPIDAANELEKLLAHSPNEPRAHLVLGSIYADQLQDTARARQHYQKLLEVDPRNLQAMTVRSWLSNHPN